MSTQELNQLVEALKTVTELPMLPMTATEMMRFEYEYGKAATVIGDYVIVRRHDYLEERRQFRVAAMRCREPRDQDEVIDRWRAVQGQGQF